jgi:hypothetical protein
MERNFHDDTNRSGPGWKEALRNGRQSYPNSAVEYVGVGPPSEEEKRRLTES